MKPATKAGDIFLSREIYCDEAVALAASVFEGRAGLRVEKAPGGFVAGAAGTAASGFCPECLALDFANEVLNQQCRIDLSRRNFKIASIIATKALLSAAGVEQSGAAPAKKKR